MDKKTSPARLLLIDDNEQFRLTLTNAFARRGWRVRATPDAREALVLAEAGTPSYAVVDLNLDGCTTAGLNLISRLLEIAPAMRIVVLTGYASIATAVKAIQLGALHYLSKPTDVDEILAAFQRTGGDASTPLPPLPMSVYQLEWEHLQRTLLDHDGNISAAARALKLHRRSLQRKLRKHARW
ncbi:MAG TPA: response regulator [Rhodocyclaceae bacterium]|nr:response regulator [Rhodocyclaceae bacterium]